MKLYVKLGKKELVLHYEIAEHEVSEKSKRVVLKTSVLKTPEKLHAENFSAVLGLILFSIYV